METERRARIIAAVCTAVLAVLVCFLLTVVYIGLPEKVLQPEHAEILLVEEEEEFVDFLEPVSTPEKVKNESSSYLPEPEKNQSQPTPAAGTDLVDKGPKNDPPKVVSSKEPSDVKVKKESPKQEGATVDKKKQEEEEIKRQASNEVANAFKNANGKNNSLNGTKDEGKNGTNTVAPGSQGTTGTGSGTVGGGWIIPKYAPVKSTVTGSVKMIVKIDKTGHVTSVEFNGGQPPAATNSSVRAAIEREIRSRKFSRANYDDAESATAYITYTFK